MFSVMSRTTRENNSMKTAIECKQGTPAYAGDISGDRKKETIKTIQMDRAMLMIHHWTLYSRFGRILFYLLSAIITAFGGSQVGSLHEHNSLTSRHSSQAQGRGKVGSRRVRARNPWCLSEKLKQIREWRRRVKTSRGTVSLLAFTAAESAAWESSTTPGLVAVWPAADIWKYDSK